jgi:hypothetical protein
MPIKQLLFCYVTMLSHLTVVCYMYHSFEFTIFITQVFTTHTFLPFKLLTFSGIWWVALPYTILHYTTGLPVIIFNIEFEHDFFNQRKEWPRPYKKYTHKESCWLHHIWLINRYYTYLFSFGFILSYICIFRLRRCN